MRIGILGVGDDDRALVFDWQLTALDNSGPEIPCAPALVLARKLVADADLPRGAMACLDLVSLAELMSELADLPISLELEIT